MKRSGEGRTLRPRLPPSALRLPPSWGGGSMLVLSRRESERIKLGDLDSCSP